MLDSPWHPQQGQHLPQDRHAPPRHEDGAVVGGEEAEGLPAAALSQVVHGHHGVVAGANGVPFFLWKMDLKNFKKLFVGKGNLGKCLPGVDDGLRRGSHHRNLP